MLMIKAIVRPEKKDLVLADLAEAGFNAATIVDVVGRGKQKGLNLDGLVYDEFPKTMIIMVINNEDKTKVTDIILQTAKSGSTGLFGDGKIFVFPVDAVYTVSSGKNEL